MRTFPRRVGVGSMSAVAALGLWLSAAGAEVLSISCGAVGKELALCRSGAEAWARRSGHEVRVVTAPSATNERLALYQQLLAAGSADVDVFQIDVVWPGILGEHFIDLRPYTGGKERSHFPAVVANNEVGGMLVAMPWFASMGLLYYRKDLLEKYHLPVPETWSGLTETARRVQAAERQAGNDRMWGFVWQGRAYEGLTCNALEWIAGHGGGTLIDDSGKVTLDNPAAARALELAASWVGEISPPGILNYDEEQARGVFQSGHAVFMRNWPYAWALSQAEDSPVRDRVGVAPLPRGGPGGRPVSTLGGWNLAVSRYSAHPQAAADLVLFLTSEAEQKRRAVEASFNPTIVRLYRDAEVLAANPFMGFIGSSLQDAVARPSAASGGRYNRVSSRFWNAVHRVLTGRQAARPALHRLARDLERILRRGRRRG
jgi:trehalose/maltose transport system substrate-binding protein